MAHDARAHGFTFLGLLFLIALMGLMAAAAAATWSFTGQRSKEQELLFAGKEYRTAIARYAAAHAGEAQRYPTALEQLLGGDDRLVPVRYLRRLYFDPMTGNATWGLVKTPSGGITGVYSLSVQHPIRTQPMAADDGVAFAQARSYRDWVFAVAADGSAGDAATRPRGAIPGWNYARDGEPPLTWENAPPTATATVVPVAPD